MRERTGDEGKRDPGSPAPTREETLEGGAQARPGPWLFDPRAILSLQKTLGNAAVTRLVASRRDAPTPARYDPTATKEPPSIGSKAPDGGTKLTGGDTKAGTPKDVVLDTTKSTKSAGLAGTAATGKGVVLEGTKNAVGGTKLGGDTKAGTPKDVLLDATKSTKSAGLAGTAPTGKGVVLEGTKNAAGGTKLGGAGTKAGTPKDVVLDSTKSTKSAGLAGTGTVGKTVVLDGTKTDGGGAGTKAVDLGATTNAKQAATPKDVIYEGAKSTDLLGGSKQAAAKSAPVGTAKGYEVPAGSKDVVLGATKEAAPIGKDPAGTKGSAPVGGKGLVLGGTTSGSAFGAGVGGSGSAAGTDTSDEVAKWKGGVQDATKNVQKPDVKSALDAAADLKQKGAALDQQRRKDQPDYMKEAQATAGPAPAVDEAPQPEPEPVPGALAMVKAAGERLLSDQSFPPLERSPRHAGLPDGGGRLPGAPPVPEPTPEPATATATTGTKTPHDAQADEIRQKTDQPLKPAASGPGETVTLRDTAPPPDQPAPPEMRADLGDAIAVVLASAPQHAEDFTRGAVNLAYPEGALDLVAPEIGLKIKGELATEIDTELKAVAEASGIAVKELNAKVEAQKAALQQNAATAADELKKAGEDVKKQTEQRGADETAKTADAKKAVDQAADQKEKAAGGQPSPAAIEAKRDSLLEQVTQEAAAASARFRRAGENREGELARVAQEQIAAYKATAITQATEIQGLKEYQDAEGVTTDQGRLASRPTLEWGEQRANAVQEALRVMKKSAAADVKARDREVEQAADTAREQIRDWAASKLGRKRSWLERLIDRFRDWATKAKAKSQAWEQERNRATRDGLVADYRMLDDMRDLMASGNTKKFEEAYSKLSLEQQAVVEAYIGSGGNRVMALANSVLIKLRQRRVPELIEKAREETMKLEKWNDPANWELLNRLGAAQTPGFDAGMLAREVRDGIDRWGTEEDQVYAALRQVRTPIQSLALKKAYAFFYDGDDLEDDLEGDFSGADEDRVLAMARGDQVLADVVQLEDAMSWPGTDEDAIMNVLRNKSPAEREALMERYKKQTGIDLKAHLEDEMSGEDLGQAMALMEGNTTKADALELRRAMKGPGTDEEKIERVYTRIREEVEGEAEARRMTTAEVEAEVNKRIQAVNREYDATKDKDDLPLKEALADELEDDAGRELALALADNDQSRVDAARVRMEAESTYVADDVVNGLLRAQGERARREIMRDKRIWFEDWSSKITETDPKKRKAMVEAKWKEIEAQADTEIAGRSRAYMGGVTTAYNDMTKRYTAARPWLGPGQAEENMATFDLDKLVDSEMSGVSEEIAKKLRENGRLEEWEEIHYALKGSDLLLFYAGTDEDVLKRVLRNKTEEQLNALRQKYNVGTKGRNLDDDVLGDLSGRDKFDVKLMLMGEPKTEEERLKRLQMKRDFETNVGAGAFAPLAFPIAGPAGVAALYATSPGGGAGLGTYLTGEERRLLDQSTDMAKTAFDEYQAALKEFGEDSPITKERLMRFRRWAGYGERDVEEHREEVDAITDAIATAVAFVVAAAVVIGSGGTATPAVIAVVAAKAAAAAAAAAIATKMMLKGPNAYGWEDVATDAGLAVVDVAAAYLTAGIGNAILASQAGGVLRRMAQRGLISRLSSQLITEGIENAVGSLPSGFLAALANDDTWRSGNPLAAVLRQTGMSGVQAFAITGVTVGGSAGLSAAGSFVKGLRVPRAATPRLDIPVVKTDDVPGTAGDVTGKAGDVPGKAGDVPGKPGAPGGPGGPGGPTRPGGGGGAGGETGTNIIDTPVDESVIKPIVIQAWKDSPPVKVVAYNPKYGPRAEVSGYITQEKAIRGKTAAQLESILGFKKGTLAEGFMVYRLKRLPEADEFALRGYTQQPGGKHPSNVPPDVLERYPVGEGVSQWELTKPIPVEPPIRIGPDGRYVPDAPKGAPSGAAGKPGKPTAEVTGKPPELPEELRLDQALPADLRNRGVVQVDRTGKLKAGEVRVVPTIEPPGVVTGVSILVGPGTPPLSVEQHVPTFRAMQKYAAMGGDLANLQQRATSFTAGHAGVKPGTAAWEAQLEVDKLRLILDERLGRLKGAQLDDTAHASLRKDIESLDSQLRYYERLLRKFELDPAKGLVPGKGYVAAMAAHTDFPHLTAELTAIETELAATGRSALTSIIDEAARLQKAGKLDGFDDWVRDTHTRKDADLARVTNELLEAKRLVAQVDADPKLAGAVVKIAEDVASVKAARAAGTLAPTSFDISVTQGGSKLRQVEIFTEQADITGVGSFKEGIKHGADAIAPPPGPGTVLPVPPSRESTVIVKWPPPTPQPDPPNIREFLPDGTYQIKGPDPSTPGGMKTYRTGNLIDELAKNLNANKGFSATVPYHYLSGVNIVDASGKLLFRLENPGAATGKPNWKPVP